MSLNIKGQVEAILKLLEQTTSKDVLTDFLKEKQLHFSGTWEELFSKRVYPAVESSEIKLEELVELLAKSEETGRQHIFLYQLPESELGNLSSEKLLEKLKIANLSTLLANPLVLDKPEEPTISAVRFDKDGCFVLKAISTRTRYEYIGDVVENDILQKRYNIIKSRAISLFKLHTSGLVEIRISSKSHTTKYQEDVDAFLKMLEPIVPRLKVTSFPLCLFNAKNKIWENKNTLSDVLRFSDATLKNNNGTTLRAATGDRDSDLLDDKAAASSMEQFTGDDVYCETNNIFFKKVKGQEVPSREVHVLMSGEVNEFTITAYCKDSDYEYILKNLLKFNEE
ncbi:hypothetical protein AMS57_18270 [Pseudoalteromonas undina]|uniref:hypothetical protein n=1 Tax=Pseudoalteromonas undina TaxID=43660 RepID=UPI0006BB4116|nr:hypothetical protein [Pseudoalteromonas undina]KPH89194.1 hypothetical protein AMS57_18270 [Pseudoalteromonas undina]